MVEKAKNCQKIELDKAFNESFASFFTLLSRFVLSLSVFFSTSYPCPNFFLPIVFFASCLSFVFSLLVFFPTSHSGPTSFLLFSFLAFCFGLFALRFGLISSLTLFGSFFPISSIFTWYVFPSVVSYNSLICPQSTS